MPLYAKGHNIQETCGQHHNIQETCGQHHNIQETCGQHHNIQETCGQHHNIHAYFENQYHTYFSDKRSLNANRNISSFLMTYSSLMVNDGIQLYVTSHVEII